MTLVVVIALQFWHLQVSTALSRAIVVESAGGKHKMSRLELMDDILLTHIAAMVLAL